MRNGANETKSFSNKERGAPLFDFKKAMLYSLLISLFLLAIGTASATITIQGELPESGGPFIVKLFENATDCSDTNYIATDTKSGSVSYSGSQADYNLTRTGNISDAWIYYCTDTVAGAEAVYYNPGAITDSGQTLQYNIGRINGTNVGEYTPGSDDLDNDYVIACAGDTKRSTKVVQVSGGTTHDYTLYYMNLPAVDNMVTVAFDNDATSSCTMNTTISAAKDVAYASNSAENYGIYFSFSPNYLATGELHADLQDGNIYVKDVADLNRGKLALVSAFTGSPDYNLYYDDPASGTLTMNLYKSGSAVNVPNETIHSLPRNFAVWDANIKLDGALPTTISNVSTTIDSGIDVNTVVSSAAFALYIPDANTPTLIYNNTQGTKVYSNVYAAPVNAANTANISMVSGEAHSLLNNATKASIEIFTDNVCGTAVTKASGDPNYREHPTANTGADFNIYFQGNNGTYYSFVWYNDGSGDFNTCGNAVTVASQMGTLDLVRHLDGKVPTSGLTNIYIDYDQNGFDVGTDANTDDINTAGNYHAFGKSDNSANILFYNGATVEVSKSSVVLTADATVNVAKVSGNTHASVNDGGGETVVIFSDSGCSITQLSDQTENPLLGSTPNYTQYYISSGSANYYLKLGAVIGANTYYSCIKFAGTGNGASDTLAITRQLTGQIPTGVSTVAVDLTKIGDYNVRSSSTSGTTPDITYYVYMPTDVDTAADVNFLDGSSNVLLSRNGVLNADETLYVARVMGAVHNNLKGASDNFQVCSDLTCNTQYSSEAASATGGTFTQYYEVTSANTQGLILRVKDVSDNAKNYYFDVNFCAVGMDGNVNYGDTNTINLTAMLTGIVPTEILSVWVTNTTHKADDNVWLYAALPTDGNYVLYNDMTSSTDFNYVKFDEGVSEKDGVNLAINHAIKDQTLNIDAIRGQVPWDFFGATLETEMIGNDGVCGTNRFGNEAGVTSSGGTDTVVNTLYYDYQLYVDANGADYNVLFCNFAAVPTILLNRAKPSSTTGGVYHDLNVGKISGETLTVLETAVGGADDIQVFSNSTLTTLLSSQAVQPADTAGGVDYNTFFETTAGTAYYYLRATSNQGGTAIFNSSIKVPWAGSADLNTVYNINTKLYGTYVAGIESAAVLLSGSSDWNAYSNDKPNGNEYQVYCTAGAATDTAKFYSADDVGGTLLLSYTANMTGDNNFHVSKVTGNAHADLQETDARDNVEVYDGGISRCTTLLSSENVNMSGGTYTQYFKSVPGTVTPLIYLNVLDRNGSYDYNTCLNTAATDLNGTSFPYNLNEKVGGYVATGLTNVKLDLGGEGTADTNSNIVTGTIPNTYNIFSAGNNTTTALFYVQDSLELSRSTDTFGPTTLMMNVGKVSGETHANLENATRRDDVQVFSTITSNACATQLSSELEQPSTLTGADFNQFFEAQDGAYDNTFYFARYTYGVNTEDYNTCDMNGFKTVNLEYAGADAQRMVSGTVPDISTGNPDILYVMSDINASGQPNGATAPVDSSSTLYYLFLNLGAAGASDDVNFYSDSAGTVQQFGKTLNLGSDQTINVSLVFGETGTALEGGTDSIAVCASGLPNTYTDTTCDSYASTRTQYPGNNAATADYNVFFEQSANTVYFLQIKDMNNFGGQNWNTGDHNFYSYNKFTSAAAGSRLDVDLNANLSGYLFEEYNKALPIADVNVNLLTQTGDWNAFTFTNVDGNYAAYSSGLYDFSFVKAGHITRNYSTNAGEMNDILLSTVLDTNLLNGVIVTVTDDTGNVITDATVEVVTNTNPITLLTGCTNTPTTTCKRTGDNTSGNGSSGKYYFAGFSMPSTVWVRAYKTGWETTTSPQADATGQTVTSTSNYVVTVYINDETVEAPSLNYPGDYNYLNYSTPTFTWFDVGKDEVDYNIMVDNDSDFSSPLINTDLTGGDDLDYAATAYGSLPDGRYYWKVAAIDLEGTGYWSVVNTFYVDTNLPTAPTLTAINSNNTARLTWTAGADTTSGIDYYNVYAAYATDPTKTSTYRIVSDLTNPEYTYSPQWNGTWHFGVTAVDRAGNESAISGIKQVAIDLNAPTGVTVLIADGNLYTNSTSVKLDVNATGATTCEYSVDNVTWTSITCGSNATITLPSVDGVKTVYAQAIDGNQNVGQASDTIILDSAVPTAPTATATASGNQIIITWTTGSDATSGIDYYKLYRKTSTGVAITDTLVVSTEGLSYVDSPAETGTYYYALTAIDKAGWESAIGTQSSAAVDFNAPTGVTVLIADGNSYTTSTTVKIDVNATGAATCQYSIDNTTWNVITCGSNANITLGNTGVNTVYARAIDGNQNTTNASDTIIYDAALPTNPTLTATASNSEIILTWTTGSDATSGIDYYRIYRKYNATGVTTSDTLIATTAGQSIADQPAYTGTYYYGVVTVDKAGNASAIGSETSATVDFNVPTEVSIVINDGNTYTVTTSVTIDTNAQNATLCQYKTEDDTIWTDMTCASSNTGVTLSGVEGVRTVYFRAIDAAQNVAQASDTIIYDASAPETAPSSLAATTLTNQAVLSWTAGSDAVSGIKNYRVYRNTTSGVLGTLIGTATGTVYTDAPGMTGTYYYIVRAVNNVDLVETNTTEATASVDFNGPVALAVSINDGNMYTNSATVSIDFSVSGANTCEYTVNTGSTWAAASCTGTTVVTLPAGDGDKNVCVRAIDVNNNYVSACDTIYLDTTAPGTPTFKFPVATITTIGRDFQWQWNASSGTGSPIDYYLVTLTSTTTVDTYTTQELYTKDYSKDLNNGKVYVLAVVAFDQAGNPSGTLTFSSVTIDLNSPITAVTAPTGDTNDTTPTITITVSSAVQTCEFLVSKDGGVNGFINSEPITASGNSCTWTVPAWNAMAHGNTFSIAATVTDQAGQDRTLTFTRNYLIDTEAPTVIITSPSSSTILSDTTPQISFSAADNAVGETGLDWSRFIVDINGVTRAVDLSCTITDSNIVFVCDFNVPATAGIVFVNGVAENYISVTVADRAGNYSTTDTVTDLNVDTSDYITLNSITAVNTNGQADDTNTHAWKWDFDIAIGIGSIGADKNYVRFKLANWTSTTTTTTLYVDGNAEMIYDANVGGVQTTKVYNIKTTYDTTQTIWPMWDHNSATAAIDANFYIQQRIPSSIAAGQYSTTYGIKTYAS